MRADGAIRVPDGTAAAALCGSPMATVVGAGLPFVATKRWTNACAVLPPAARRVAPSSGARRHAALGRQHAAQPCAVPPGPTSAGPLGPPCAAPLAPTFVVRLAEPQVLPRERRRAVRLHADAVLRLLPAYQRPAPLPAAACLFVLSFFPPPGRVPSFNRLNGGGFVNRRFHRGDVIGDERFLISGDR